MTKAQIDNATKLVSDFSKLDYVTQESIIREFCDLSPERKHHTNFKSIDHIPAYEFSLNQFYGGFLIVIAVITILGKLLG